MSGKEPTGGKQKKVSEKDIEALKTGKVGDEFEPFLQLYLPYFIPVQVVRPMNIIALKTAREMNNVLTVGRRQALEPTDNALGEFLRSFDESMEANVVARMRRRERHARGSAI